MEYSVPAIRSLDICNESFASNDVVQMKNQFQNLSKVSIDGTSGPLYVQWFVAISGLSSLQFKNCILWGGGDLPACQGQFSNCFTTLCIGPGCTVDQFSFLSKVFSITKLIINCGNLTLVDLGKLPDTVRLTELDVSGSEAACDGLIDFLIDRRFPIVTLKLDRDIGNRYMEDRLSSFAITDYLSWTSTLKNLSLHRNWGITADIFNADDGYLQTLERLDIVGTQCGKALDGVLQLRQKRDDLLAAGVTLPTVTVIVNPRYEHKVITDFTPVSGNGLIVKVEDDMYTLNDEHGIPEDAEIIYVGWE